MIDRALVIAEPWIGMILSGEKVWEIRNRPNMRTGPIALAQKGGPLLGTATIAGAIPVRPEEFAMYKPKHRIEPAALWEMYGGEDVFAWPLSEVIRFDPPIDYTHPRGGSWVTLTPENVKEWGRLQGEGRESSADSSPR